MDGCDVKRMQEVSHTALVYSVKSTTTCYIVVMCLINNMSVLCSEGIYFSFEVVISHNNWYTHTFCFAFNFVCYYVLGRYWYIHCLYITMQLRLL